MSRFGRNGALLVLTALPFLGWTGPAAKADDAPPSQITDLTYVGMQQLPPDDAKDINATKNEFKFVKVFFRTSSDLAALAKAYDRDVRIAAYPCKATRYNMYNDDPIVFDAYGQVTRDRSVTKMDALEKFKGLYYFFMPTNSGYGAGTGYSFGSIYFLYVDQPLPMCLQIQGTSSNFFSNTMTITPEQITAVLAKRPR